MTRASDLLERAERAYSACESYSDTGTARFRDQPEATFSTSFDRATDTLTFDYRDVDFRVSFVATDGRLVTFEATPPRIASFVPEGANLERALAYLTGITCGAAVLVPDRLRSIPRGLGRRSPGDPPPASVGEEVLGGERCAWIELSRSSRVLIAIGETSALVRRMVMLGNRLPSWDLARYAASADGMVTYEPRWSRPVF